MKVLIGSKNNAKIEGAKKAFERYFQNVEIQGIPVESNVPEQPVNHEIYLGSKNRVENLKKYAKENKLEADFYVAIESGIQNALGKWMITNIAVIEDNKGTESCGTSPSIPVPERYVQEIIQNGFSSVMDRVFTEDKERHNKGGGVQLLTQNAITRADLTESAFVMALIEFINGDSWK